MIEIIAGALTLPAAADSHTSPRPALVVDHLDTSADDSVALFTFCTLLSGTNAGTELSHA
ncbi:hypothetical protein [Streptomyces sp. BA2]|uniref:hypothetical protein n=1 Tax=Streptomyces sp. BA2 TaxID=436595 RepID=UPI001321F171|nr:hypothetical protein [Streptomyces sp. BA2]MWA13332.1 hypothetical protein [Streptomyces sp. BA2]